MSCTGHRAAASSGLRCQPASRLSGRADARPGLWTEHADAECTVEQRRYTVLCVHGCAAAGLPTEDALESPVESTGTTLVCLHTSFSVSAANTCMPLCIHSACDGSCAAGRHLGQHLSSRRNRLPALHLGGDCPTQAREQGHTCSFVNDKCQLQRFHFVSFHC